MAAKRGRPKVFMRARAQYLLRLPPELHKRLLLFARQSDTYASDLLIEWINQGLARASQKRQGGRV